MFENVFPSVLTFPFLINYVSMWFIFILVINQDCLKRHCGIVETIQKNNR